MKELIVKGLKTGLVAGVALITVNTVLAIASIPGTYLEVIAERRLEKLKLKEEENKA